MKILQGVIVAAVVVAGAESAYAAKSKCEFSQNTVNATTGAKLIQTEFDKVITSMSFRPSEAIGAISVLQDGERRYLVVRLEAIDHFPLPADLGIYEDPNWHPEYRDWLDSLLGDTAIFPAGATVRLDLDDGSAVYLARENDLRVRTHYAEPGQSVTNRDSSTKALKGLVGFLAKSAGTDVDTDGDASRYYSVQTKAVLRYPIDAESEDILSRANVTGMRIESRDRYYVMGYRTTREFVGWSEKSYGKIKEALNCVVTEAGGR